MMDNQESLIREYVAYLESKDRFVDRSFAVNRFYLVIVLILMVSMFYLIENQTDTVSIVVIIIAAAGMGISMLWWLNQDSYAYLIKVKLSAVLEKFEEQLPIQSHKLEYEEIKEHNKKKKVMFVDLQKGVSFSAFSIFFAMFLYHIGVKLLLLFPFLLR